MHAIPPAILFPRIEKQEMLIIASMGWSTKPVATEIRSVIQLDLCRTVGAIQVFIKQNLVN